VTTLGDFIRDRRVEKGLTLHAVAKAIGVSTAFVCDLEKNRRNTDRVDALARVLGVDVEELRALDRREPRARIDELERRVAELEARMRVVGG